MNCWQKNSDGNQKKHCLLQNSDIKRYYKSYNNQILNIKNDCSVYMYVFLSVSLAGFDIAKIIFKEKQILLDMLCLNTVNSITARKTCRKPIKAF
jgi:hypothetical protein